MIGAGERKAIMGVKVNAASCQNKGRFTNASMQRNREALRELAKR